MFPDEAACLSVTPFEKMPISSVFFGKITKNETCCNPKQLTLFDLKWTLVHKSNIFLLSEPPCSIGHPPKEGNVQNHFVLYWSLRSRINGYSTFHSNTPPEKFSCN